MTIVFPVHAKPLGTLFGGRGLARMDEAALIAAPRLARRTVGTASSEPVNFLSPIRQGDLVEVVARVTGVGRSSMQVDRARTAESIHSGERRLCATGRLHMIALDGQGRPHPSSQRTAAEKTRPAGLPAGLRRRRQNRPQNASSKATSPSTPTW